MRRALLIGVLMLLVLVGGWIGAPKVLRRLAFFRIHQVEVVGNRYLVESDVVQRLGLRPDASIFDPLEKIRSAAAVIPGTIGASASVERRFPGTLRVQIVEVAPVAMASVNDQLALLDHHGKVLPFDPTRVPASLPLAQRDSTVVELLSRLRQVEPDIYADVLSARDDHGDVLLDLGEHLIRLRPNADALTMRSVMAVRGTLEQASRKWTEIDARYDGRVFVRKAKG